MALHTAVRRLRMQSYATELDEVQKLLWETAVRVEVGTVSLAERNFRQAQQEILQALARGVPESGLDRLIGQLQTALSAYLNILQQKMANNQQSNPEIDQINPNMKMINRQDLQQMMEEIRDELRRRAADPSRKRRERDYVDRLLNRF